MANSYNSLCDDFYVDMTINTELELPGNRETILSFFELIQKRMPELNNFYRRETGDYGLSQIKDSEKYRTVLLETDRVNSSCANPVDLEDAYNLHSVVADLAPYMLGISHLDFECLDLTFTMDFDYAGNHDEVVAEALLTPTAFSDLLNFPGARPIGFSPSATIALTNDCRRQARISIDSRSSVYDLRNENFKSDDPISLYLTVRQYPDPEERFNAVQAFKNLFNIVEELMADKIIPNFVTPLASAIAQRR